MKWNDLTVWKLESNKQHKQNHYEAVWLSVLSGGFSGRLRPPGPSGVEFPTNTSKAREIFFCSSSNWLQKFLCSAVCSAKLTAIWCKFWLVCRSSRMMVSATVELFWCEEWVCLLYMSISFPRVSCNWLELFVANLLWRRVLFLLPRDVLTYGCLSSWCCAGAVRAFSGSVAGSSTLHAFSGSKIVKIQKCY